MTFTRPLAKLIESFQKFPGVGPKSAQRMALYLLDMKHAEVQELASAILDAKEKIKRCSQCFHLTVESLCELCSNPRRDPHTICVVADSRDVIAIEKTREYKGLYHVLTGLISPLDGRGPGDLTIGEFVNRVGSRQVKEVILAISPTVEGDATALYLNSIVNPLGVKVTRIAFGLPVGGDLEYADDLTLVRAFEGRREV